MKVRVEEMKLNGKQHYRVSVCTEGFEPITIYSLLEVLKWIFRSEDIGYPEGSGRWYTLRAIQDVANGESPAQVVKKYDSHASILDQFEFIQLPTEKKTRISLPTRPRGRVTVDQFNH